MTRAKQDRIVTMWEAMDDDDVSTERLLATVAGMCGCDDCDVVEALVNAGILKEGESE